MAWSKPDFVEITLCMEVTAYVNTDDSIGGGGQRALSREEQPARVVSDSSSTPKADD